MRRFFKSWIIMPAMAIMAAGLSSCATVHKHHRHPHRHRAVFITVERETGAQQNQDSLMLNRCLATTGPTVYGSTE